MGGARGHPAGDAAGDAVHHARDAHLPARLLRPFGRPARPGRELPRNVQRPDGNLPAAGLEPHVRSDEDHGRDHGLLPAAHLPHRALRHELRPGQGQHARARLAVRLRVLLVHRPLGRGRPLRLGEAEALAVSVHRIFGSELSPYSVKVRSYFRYKGLAHEWLLRSPANQAEFQKFAKLPLVPLVVTPDGVGIQDSTPIIETFEASSPVLRPDDQALAFLSALIEEYGDEWGNKWMFSYRWAYVPDAWATAERIAQQMVGAQGTLGVAQARAAVAERMTGRLGFVGSNATTRPLIEASFKRALEILDKHLASRPYLLGGRPAMADLGLWAQFYEAATDPTPGAIMRAAAPNVMAWVQRMLSPNAEGPFEGWSSLSAGLMPLLTEEVGRLFLPWSTANAKAIAGNEKTLTVTLAGAEGTQEPQKYHARSLQEIRRKYAAARSAALDGILEKAGCLSVLRSGV
ncbi:MAG: glutathione S-transferase family protein [Proteobacteria bacterium]|nr:glutathione S-transferase family protein [Pseudomonadota bacterium]